MLKAIQQRDKDRNRWIKITMGVILSLIIISMVVTLIPGLLSGTDDTASPDNIASINGQNISVVDFQNQYNMITRNEAIPDMLKGIYARQVLDDMIFKRALVV